MADILYTYLEIVVGLAVYFSIALLFCVYYVWKARRKHG